MTNRYLSILIVVILVIGVLGLSCSGSINGTSSKSTNQTSANVSSTSLARATTAQGIWPQGTYTATEVIWGKVVKATATFSGDASLKLYDPVHGETLYSCYWVADYTGAIHTIRLTNVATGEVSVESLIYNLSAGTVVLDGPVAEATYFK